MKRDGTDNAKRNGKSGTNIGWCQWHDKLFYVNRSVARIAAKRLHPGQHKAAYPCNVHPDFWHIGTPPKDVIQGKASRADIRQTAR